MKNKISSRRKDEIQYLSWTATTLGNVLPIKYGKARTHQHGQPRANTPVYGSSGIIGTFERALTKGPALIIGRKGTVGAVYYSPEPCWPIDTVYFTEETPERSFVFFKYLLEHLQLGKLDRSTAVPGLSRDDYNVKEVSIPSLAEQQQIVAEIEKQFTRLDAGVSALRRLQTNLKRYRAAVLNAACEGKLVPTEAELAKNERRKYETGTELLERVLAERRQNWDGRRNYLEPAHPKIMNIRGVPGGWAVASLEQMTSANRPICYGILMPKEHVINGIPYVKVRDMKGDKIDFTTLPRTSPAIAAKYARASLKSGDVLLSIRGTYGRVVIAPPELEGGNITQDTARVAVTSFADRRYIAWFLRSEHAQNYFKRVARGVAVKGVNIGDVRPFPIFLPSLAEQTRIVEEVERRLSVVEELDVVVTANLQRAARLRQAILKRAFLEA